MVEKKVGDLNLKNMKLVEQMSLAEVKAINLEKKLSMVEEELVTQKASYESRLEFLQTTHKT